MQPGLAGNPERDETIAVRRLLRPPSTKPLWPMTAWHWRPVRRVSREVRKR
jgi:hypothetical protein